MQFVIPVVGFLVLVAVLSGLRTRLIQELVRTSFLLFHTTTPGLTLYSLLVLPGTIIHELSHWLTAEILRVRTGRIVILPELTQHESAKRLGSVEAEKTDPFRGFLIGVAPFISGILILLVLGRLLELGWPTSPWWSLALIIYGIMVTGNSMLLSQEDRRTWPIILIFALLIFTLIFRSYPSLITDHWSSVIDVLSPLNMVLGVTAAFNLAMIFGLYLVRRLIEKLTKRRII